MRFSSWCSSLIVRLAAAAEHIIQDSIIIHYMSCTNKVWKQAAAGFLTLQLSQSFLYLMRVRVGVKHSFISHKIWKLCTNSIHKLSRNLQFSPHASLLTFSSSFFLLTASSFICSFFLQPVFHMKSTEKTPTDNKLFLLMKHCLCGNEM